MPPDGRANLAYVDGRVDAVSHVHEQVAAQDVEVSRERVHLHLAARHAIGKVAEEIATPLLPVKVQVRCGMEAVGCEVDAATVGLLHPALPAGARMSGHDGGQARHQLLTRVLGGGGGGGEEGGGFTVSHTPRFCWRESGEGAWHGRGCGMAGTQERVRTEYGV